MKNIVMVFLSILFLIGCKPLPHHGIHAEILLKDKIYLHILIDYIVETPEALKEVQLKSDQLGFGLRLALREHNSTMLKGRGKRSVLNALQAIARQVLDHKVKEIKILEYTFYDRNEHPPAPNKKI